MGLPIREMGLLDTDATFSLRGMGLLDTGATFSHIDLGIAAHHKFRHIGVVRSDTASTLDAKAPVFEAMFELSELSTNTFPVRAVGFPARQDGNKLPTEQLIALVGQDILDQGCLVYDGVNRNFTLEFP
jgi:hypothetical protein